MNIVRIVGASFVACTALLSVQSGAVAVESKGEGAATKRAANAVWNADMRAGKYTSAIGKLNKILASKSLSDEQKAMAHINRGLARQQLKQYKKAVVDYSAALAMDAMSNKTRAIVIYNRGIAHQKLKRQARAIDDFTNALYLDVEFSHAYYGRARLMHEVGRFEFALADYAKAMKYRHPAPHLPFYGQALAYQATQQNAQARRALSRALLLKPNFKPALERYKEIAGVAFNPRKRQPATKLQTAQAAGGQLPAAKTPPKEFLKIAGGDAADGIITNSVASAPERVASADTATSLKLPYRYPGLIGTTKPTPGKTPGKKLMDLRASKQAGKIAKVLKKPAKDAEIAAAPPVPKDAKAKKRALRVAALGKNAEIAAMKMAKIAPDPVKAAEPEPLVQTAKNPTVEKTPEASETISSKQASGWLIQLNSQRSEDAAKSAWSRYKSKHKSLFSKVKPVIQRADLGDKGIYYRLRLGGYGNRDSAVKKCGQLKDKGLSCYVVKAAG